ncbi:MAG: PDZ domain-containing protein [Armatimonadetes bacterium]|nr:PDZ domain-containing protein [Armatimonadota bacterium]
MLFPLLLVCAFTRAEELPVIRDVHYPDLNPDATQIAFEYQGDIWVANVEDGIGRRLTVSDAYESRPRFSPDGKSIAFVSDRYGNPDVFIMPAAGGTIQRVTYHTASDVLADWSPDGKKLLLTVSGRGHQFAAPYEIEVEGGFIRPVVLDCCSISITGYSPDGRYVTGIRRGTSWWRKDYKGSANPQVLVYDTQSDAMQIVTDYEGMDNWPVFVGDGSRLCFVSERQGRPNVFSMKADGSDVKALTDFERDAVTFLTVSGNREWLVFEWNFDVWMLRASGGEPRKITLRAPLDYRQTFETVETLKSGIEEMEVNRDGSLVAIRLKDDIFFVKPEFKNDSIRITDWPGPDGDYFWSPDGKQLAYISQMKGKSGIWVVDGQTREKRCLVDDPKYYLDMIGYTRDGGKILFRHDVGGDGIFAANPQTGEVSQFLPDPSTEDVAISPDGRWLLAQIEDARSGTDLYIKPLEGGKWINVTQHPDGNWGCHWSPDGKKIYFVSRRDGNAEVYSIDLQRQPDKFEDYAEQQKEKDEKEQTKKPEAPKAPAEPPKAEAEKKPDEAKPEAEKKPDEEKKLAEGEKPKEEPFKPPTIDPFEIDFSRIETRAKRLTNSGEAEGNILFVRDGKTVVYTKNNEIWAMDADGSNQRRHVNGSFRLGNVRLQGDGKAIFFVDDGKLKKVSADGGNPSDIDWKAEIKRDSRLVQKEAFRQAWALLDEQFYHQPMHDRDWKAVYQWYAPFCDGTLDREDLHHLIGRMIGELDASHLGISGGEPGGSSPPTACLGITPDPKHRGPGLRIADVMPDSPADKPNSKLAVGEYILSLDGEAVSNNERFTELLNGRIGERVTLTVNSEPKTEGAREVAIKPVSYGDYDGLRYERWVRDNHEMAKRLSDGKVYYAHIAGMDDGSLNRFKREVFGEAQRYGALLIDVRNNGGGHTHDALLEMLTKTVHGWTARRGAPLRTSPYLQFDGPKAVLINEYSASDAEIFPNGFREKGLGPVIGMTTNGAVIGTYDVTLVNGSRFRVPTSGWFTMKGVDLENMGVKPDFEVPYPYEAYRDGRDPQIRKAVEVLLERLSKGERAEPPKVEH